MKTIKKNTPPAVFTLAILFLSTADTSASNLTVLEEKKQETKKQQATPGLVPYSDEIVIHTEDELKEEAIARHRDKCIHIEEKRNGCPHKLYRGRVLFNCKKEIRIETPLAEIKIKPDAVVYVYSTGESVAILNLHDNHRRDVGVMVEGKFIEIPPGRELLLTQYAKLKFDDARLFPGIWYRTVHELISKPKLKVYETQFSTISAFWIIPAVHGMISRDKKSGRKVLKTYAAVLSVSRDHQPFREKMSAP